MLIRVGIALMFLVWSTSPTECGAHNDDVGGEYFLKFLPEKTRIYGLAGAAKDGIYFYSFELPKGFLPDGCRDDDKRTQGKFLEGRLCLGEEFRPRNVMKKDGKVRYFYMHLRGGMGEAEEAKKERMTKLYSSGGSSAPLYAEAPIRYGIFPGAGEWAYYSVRLATGSAMKMVSIVASPCGVEGSFEERPHEEDKQFGDMKHITDPAEWLFEDVFDGIMKSVRCELVSYESLKKSAPNFYKKWVLPDLSRFISSAKKTHALKKSPPKSTNLKK